MNKEEVFDFLKNILYRYQREATNKEEGNFINNLGSDKSKIEQMRFDAIVYFDEDGNRYEGHTIPALENERAEIEKIYDSGNTRLRKKKVDEILKRQNIIKQQEVDLIPEEHLKEFEEALLKIELDVLEQDIANYNAVNKKENTAGKLANLTEENLQEHIPKEIYELVIAKKQERMQKIEESITKIQHKKLINVQEFTELYGFSSDWQKNRRGRLNDHLPYNQNMVNGKITYNIDEVEIWFKNNNKGRSK